MLIHIPVPSGAAGTNLLGLAGLVAIVVAIAALTDWRWGLLAAGIIAFGLAFAAQRFAAAEVAEPETEQAAG